MINEHSAAGWLLKVMNDGGSTDQKETLVAEEIGPSVVKMCVFVGIMG